MISLRVDGGVKADHGAVERGFDVEVTFRAALFTGHLASGDHTVEIFLRDGVESSSSTSLTCTTQLFSKTSRILEQVPNYGTTFQFRRCPDPGVA
jgi:hypothetical protein